MLIKLMENTMGQTVRNLIEKAENKNLGLFLFNDQKNAGWVFNLETQKIYSVGDFVEWASKEINV